MTTDDGRKVAYHAYYPFGRRLPASDIGIERRRYTGHERDHNVTVAANPEADDLDYLHFRYLNHQNARFLSTDPSGLFDIRVPQSFNRYAYVMDNPMRYVDPYGLFPSGLPWVECHDSITVRGVPWEIETFELPPGWNQVNVPDRGEQVSIFRETIRGVFSRPECASFRDRVNDRFDQTNIAIPGLLAPLGMTWILRGGETMARSLETATLGQWVAAGLRGQTVRGGLMMAGAQFSFLETGVLVGWTGAITFRTLGVVYEGGVAAGSVIGATIETWGCD